MAQSSALLRQTQSRPSICLRCLLASAVFPVHSLQQVRTKVLVKIARNRVKPKSKRTPSRAAQGVPTEGVGSRLKELKEQLKADYLASIPKELKQTHRQRPRHEHRLDAGEEFPPSPRVLARMERIKQQVKEKIRKSSRHGRGEISALKRRLDVAPDRSLPGSRTSREEAIRRYTEKRRAAVGLPPLRALPRTHDRRSEPQNQELELSARGRRRPQVGVIGAQASQPTKTSRSRQGVSGPTAAVTRPTPQHPRADPFAADRDRRAQTSRPDSNDLSAQPVANRYPRRRSTATPTPPPSPPGSIAPTFHELTQSLRDESCSIKRRLPPSKAHTSLFDPADTSDQLELRPAVVRSPLLDRRRAVRPKSEGKQKRADLRKAKFGDPYNHPGDTRIDGRLGTPPVMGLNTMRGGWVGEWGAKVKRENEHVERNRSATDGLPSMPESEEQVWAKLRRNEALGRENRIPFLGRSDEERRGGSSGCRLKLRSAVDQRDLVDTDPSPAQASQPLEPRPRSELARRATEILSRPPRERQIDSPGLTFPDQTLTRPRTISKGIMRSARRIQDLQRGGNVG